MKSEVKFKVRSLNFAQPVGKFTSDFIRDKKNCCHMSNETVMNRKMHRIEQKDIRVHIFHGEMQRDLHLHQHHPHPHNPI